jgi:hypothetical protein
VNFNQAIAMRRKLPLPDDQSGNTPSDGLHINCPISHILAAMSERLKNGAPGAASVTTVDVTQQTGIQKLIAEHLVPSLNKQNQWNRLSSNHPIFESARQIWNKHAFPVQAFDNFERLLCGSLDLPIILLQNPTNDNLALSYDEMVARTPDLRWLKDRLQGHGLKLDDIIIMDLFSMMDDDWLNSVDRKLYKGILKDVCDLTVHILQTIKPPIILACQNFDASRHSETWSCIRDSMPALKIMNRIPDFSSAISRAKQIEVSKVSLSEHSFHVIQAFCPAEIWHKEGDERLMMDFILAEIVREVYKPCREWKRHQEQWMKDRLEYQIQDLFDSGRNFLRALVEFTDFESLTRYVDDVLEKQLDANEDEWDRLGKEIIGRLGVDYDDL